MTHPGQKSLDFIILGTARSGTTALGNAVNLDPRTFCAIEYFKGEIDLDYSTLSIPHDFFSDRYTASHPKNTELTRQILRDKLSDGSVEIFGNKVPNYYLNVRRIHQQVPKLRSVALVRNPVHIAVSWDKRAANPNDSWPLGRTGIIALLNWALEISAYSEGINNLILASYDALFYDNPTYFEQVMCHLSKFTPEARTINRFRNDYFRGDIATNCLSPIHSSYIHNRFCSDSGCTDLMKLVREDGILDISRAKDILQPFVAGFLPSAANYICSYANNRATSDELEFLCRWMNQYVLSYDTKASPTYKFAINAFEAILASITAEDFINTPPHRRLADSLRAITF